MDTLLQVALSNAAVATALALIAGVASVVWRRRPALVHGLWLLVLLKLLTPPLARVPVPGLLPAANMATAPVADRGDAEPAGVKGPVVDVDTEPGVVDQSFLVEDLHSDQRPIAEHESSTCTTNL